jgi:hypothetical protein
MCVGSCTSIGLHLRARVFDDCVCTCSERACAPRRCVGTLMTRAGTCGIYSLARDALCSRACVVAFGATAGLARVGRRCHVDAPRGQSAVDCAIWAHDRGRRHRRHLRHRRRRRHLPLQPPGRLGEHRRRCVAGLRQREYWVGTQGVPQVPWGVLRGSMGAVRSARGVKQGYWWGTRGVSTRT